jgi:hypothetical protein
MKTPMAGAIAEAIGTTPAVLKSRVLVRLPGGGVAELAGLGSAQGPARPIPVNPVASVRDSVTRRAESPAETNGL